MQGILWRRACAYSLVTHVVMAGIAAMFVSHMALQAKQELYVIDLDSNYSSGQGSGYDGGGGGGDEQLFPEKLSTTDLQQKVMQAVNSNKPEFPSAIETPVNAENTMVNTPIFANTVQGVTSSGANNIVEGKANSTDSAGASSGNGAGMGTGAGSGSGSGVGDGQGYGEGSGVGQGSGNSGASGTGSLPFDTDGLWSAINSHKQYPLIALKRNITGSVTIQTVLDGAGNISSVSVSSSSGSNVLDQAAVNAAYAVGSYPNPTGEPVYANTTITFSLE